MNLHRDNQPFPEWAGICIWQKKLYAHSFNNNFGKHIPFLFFINVLFKSTADFRVMLTWLKSSVHCLKSAPDFWSPQRQSQGGIQTPGADFKQWTPDFQQIGRGVISILRGFLKCTRQRRVLLQIAEEDWNTLRPIWYQIILRHSREIIWRLVKHYPRNLFEHEEVLLTCC